ncbi:ankyrin repeat-containing domain protein [Xylaria scruposa]|nr:ankyrin repeat-containing domain protein [Xylaria scruposa]
MSSASCLTDIRTLADQLLQNVDKELMLDKERPIIFVSWDIGGSIVKEALLIASSSPEAWKGEIFKRITTLIFFGTPHTRVGQESWETILLKAIYRFRDRIPEDRLPRFVDRMADYHRSLEIRFHTFTHQCKVVQYFQGLEDVNVTKHIASLNCSKEEFVVRQVPLHRPEALSEPGLQRQLGAWLDESWISLDATFRSLLRELYSKSEPLLGQSRGDSPLFMRTTRLCFAHETFQTWLSTDITSPLILRIPSFLDCNPILSSFTSHLRDVVDSATGISKYQVILLDLHLVPTTYAIDATSLLSTLIHHILDHNPRFWVPLRDAIPIDELIDVIRSNAPVSELALWRVLELILASLNGHSIVCLLRLPETMSRENSMRFFVQKLLSIGKLVDTNFKCVILTTSDTLLDIGLDTDAVVAQVRADDVSLKTALRNDVVGCISTMPMRAFASISLSTAYIENLNPLNLVPNSLVAFVRYIEMQFYNASQMPHVINRLLSNLSRDNLTIIEDILRAVPAVDLPLALDLLSAVSLARRPLSVSELEAVTTSSPIYIKDVACVSGSREMLMTCLKPLLQLRGGIVGFFDQNLREAFIRHRSSSSQEPVPNKTRSGDLSSHFQMACICLKYIVSAIASYPEVASREAKDKGDSADAGDYPKNDQSLSVNEQNSLMLPSSYSSGFPFLRYSIQYWPFHLKLALCGPEELETTKLADVITSEYLGHEMFVEYWLQRTFELHFDGTTIDNSALPLAPLLSPCQIVHRYDLTLLEAIEVSLSSLSVLETLGWNSGASLAWALTKITEKFDAASALWLNSTRENANKSTALLVESMSRCPKTAIKLLQHVDREYIGSNLSYLLSRDFTFGGSTVLGYIAKNITEAFPKGLDEEMEDSMRQHSWKQLRFPERHHIISVVGFSSVIGTLLEHQDPLLLRLLDYFEGNFSPLHMVVTSGDAVTLERLIERNINLNLRDNQDRTAVFLASKYGFLHILKTLLQPGRAADVSIPNDKGQTPLYAAAESGHIRCTAALLQASAARAQATLVEDRLAPFRIAVESNYRDVVSLFLNHEDFDQSAAGKDQHEGGELDARYDKEKISYTLVNQNNEKGCSLLEISIENQHFETARLLVEKGADPNSVNNLGLRPLHLAAQQNQYGVIAALLAHKVDVNALDKLDRTALYYAAERGYVKPISLLLGAEASVVESESALSPVEIAIMAGHGQAARALLSAAHVKYSARTLGECLHRATIGGPIHVMTQLLDMGADKNYQDEDGYSALQLAAANSNVDAVCLLLVRQASLELKTSRGTTALAYAAAARSEHSIEILELLLNAGADLETTDDGGATPLSIAYSGKEINSTVLFLLKRGANIPRTRVAEDMLLRVLQLLPRADGLQVLAAQKDNFGDGDERTIYLSRLLKKACASTNKPETVTILLQHGADPNHKSVWLPRYGGLLQQQVAFFSSLPIAMALLEHPGADIDVNFVTGKYGTLLNLCVAGNSDHKSQCEMFAYLIEKSVDPLRRAGPYGTPLHTAVAVASMDIVTYILSKPNIGLSLDTLDHEGRLPAHIAAFGMNSDVLPQVLTSRYLETLDRQGRQPIHLASGTGSLPVLQHLEQLCKAEEGKLADLLRARDMDGWTPLHWACRQDDKEVIKWLVEHQRGAGVEPAVVRTANENWTPYDVASEHDNSSFCELLGNDVELETKATKFQKTSILCDSCRCSVYDKHKHYHCSTCYDFDLCFKCYRYVDSIHYEGHSFSVVEDSNP